MKRSRPAKPSRPSEASTTPCDGSPPYPSNPPPPGEIAGTEKLEFIYYGENDLAKAFNDGQLVQHTMALEDGELSYVFSLRGGPHKRRTLPKLQLTALHGSCTIVVQNGPTKVLHAGDTMDINPGSTFSFEAADKAVLLGRSLTGPGLAFPYGGPREP